MATATEQAFAASQSYIAGSQVVPTPFQFLTDVDTFLRVVSASSIGNITIGLQGRRLDDQGNLQLIDEVHTPNSDRTVKVQDYELGAGALLNLSLSLASGSATYGRVYARVQMLRNFGATAIVIGDLLGGYITTHNALGFPGSPVQSSLDGPGALILTETSFGVGAEIDFTVPEGARWEVVSVGATLVTSSHAGSRQPRLRYTDPGNTQILVSIPGSGSLGASNSAGYYWCEGVQPITSTVGDLLAPLPTGPMLFGDSHVKTLTGNLDAGDTYGVVALVTREWLEV